MKAIVYQKYGSPDVLELKEVEKPRPKDNQVLIKVHAASVNAFEWHNLRGKPLFMRLMGIGLLKPKNSILGLDIAGRVEAVGKSVKQFQPGDKVFGEANFGGYAEYVCVSEKRLVLKPANVSFEEAAAVPMAAITALQALRDNGQIQPGQGVLIHGAGGGVATLIYARAWPCATIPFEVRLSLDAYHTQGGHALIVRLHRLSLGFATLQCVLSYA